MNLMTRAWIKAGVNKSEKMLPLTLALIAAVTEQGASIAEFREAYKAADAIIQDKLDNLATCELVGNGDTAFEGFKEFLLSLKD